MDQGALGPPDPPGDPTESIPRTFSVKNPGQHESLDTSWYLAYGPLTLSTCRRLGEEACPRHAPTSDSTGGGETSGLLA